LVAGRNRGVGGMNPALIEVGTPVCLILIGSVFLFAKERTLWTFLVVLGAGCLSVVVLTHIAEALDLFPWMGWGLPASAGHYVDLVNAASGLALVFIGLFAHVLRKRLHSD
jgi:hypothetical protein